ncbi:hypothetical protein QGN29_13215 [Temperatibacter marinus]|uniref:ATPase n=1 Tax=Temperatibacter marinus TaxID=1456591 RepID=A0AA52EBV8_9PROT|nr:hypothetical protein [Temperatibacter marinus]WND02507.1 hypothetical protein QGN29_13215 [Temperatibacter marinus]
MSKAEKKLKPSKTSKKLSEKEESIPVETALAEPNSTPKIRSRRLVPLAVAVSLSIVWIAAVTYFIYGSSIVLLSLSIADLGAIFAGIFTPIALIWLMMLAFQRSDPMLERRLALSQNMHKVISPVEQAEARFEHLNKAIRKELTHIDAVADLASDRIDNLEGRFQEQINNLFSVTADVEARTTSIRDTIERERDEVGALATDLESRFSALEIQLGTIINHLDQAKDKTIETVEAAATHSSEQAGFLHHKVSEMETRLQTAGTNLSERANKVENLSLDMELRLQTIQDHLNGGMEKLRSEVSGLEERSAELSDHMQTQGKVLTELAELAAIESSKIETNLRSHVNEVRTAAEEALEKTDTVSNMFSERAQSMSETVIDTVGQAKTLLEEAGNALENHCQEALSTSGELNERAMDQTRKTASAVKEHAEEINQLLVASLERARMALDETAQGISTHAADAEQTTLETAERSLAHMRQFQASLEDEIARLEEKAEQAGISLSDKSDKLLDTATALENKADNLVERIETSNEAMQSRAEAIDEAISASASKIKTVETELEIQRTAMVTQAEEASHKVIEAAELFRDQSENIDQAARSAEDALKSNSSELKAEAERFSSATDAYNSNLTDKISNMSAANKTLQSDLAETNERLSTASEKLSQERSKLVDDSEKVIGDLEFTSDRIADKVESLTTSTSESVAQLENATQALMDETNTAQENLNKAVETAGTHLKEEVDQMGQNAAEKITIMQEDMQMTISRLLLDYQTAAESAEKESALLSARIGNEADKVAKRAEEFINKTAEIEKRIADKTKNDFARTSQMLLESLQSLSIDIHKLLATEVPDTLWQSYLKGDRSIFSRSTLKMGTRKTRKLISDRFKSDTEFRESVSRFMRDFEGLMERAMHGDKGNTLSVTLISSDMGKLYILLAQSMKKIS